MKIIEVDVVINSKQYRKQVGKHKLSTRRAGRIFTGFVLQDELNKLECNEQLVIDLNGCKNFSFKWVDGVFTRLDTFNLLHLLPQIKWTVHDNPKLLKIIANYQLSLIRETFFSGKDTRNYIKSKELIHSSFIITDLTHIIHQRKSKRSTQ